MRLIGLAGADIVGKQGIVTSIPHASKRGPRQKANVVKIQIHFNHYSVVQDPPESEVEVAIVSKSHRN